jgi:hypothetical protein
MLYMFCCLSYSCSQNGVPLGPESNKLAAWGNWLKEQANANVANLERLVPEQVLTAARRLTGIDTIARSFVP